MGLVDVIKYWLWILIFEFAPEEEFGDRRAFAFSDASLSLAEDLVGAAAAALVGVILGIFEGMAKRNLRIS